LNIFDIIGPVMVGPSSSHTAGAARLGNVVGRLLGEPVQKANIVLYESFAKTGKGHGTDKAIVGGLLGLTPDDSRLPDSFLLAERAGMNFEIVFSDQRRDHPNTAEIALTGKSRQIMAAGISVGGGRIELTQINGLDVSIKADYHTLVVFNSDQCGVTAHVTRLLAEGKINIAYMRLSRREEGKDAVMVIETDQEIPLPVLQSLKALENVSDVVYIQPFNQDVKNEDTGVN